VPIVNQPPAIGANLTLSTFSLPLLLLPLLHGFALLPLTLLHGPLLLLMLTLQLLLLSRVAGCAFFLLMTRL
jgi:hypothetical protein